MNKLLFIILFIIINQFTFSQSEAIKFLSMGFNASDNGQGGNIEYFFYGYEGYSEAMIYSEFASFGTKTPGNFFPQVRINNMLGDCGYNRYQGKNNSIGYMGFFATGIIYGLEYKFEGNKLVYWALSSDSYDSMDYMPYTTLDKIEQNVNSINIYYRDTRGIYQRRYFNVTKTELLDLFLKKYLELVCFYIKEIASYEYETFDDFIYDITQNFYINTFLGGRTARELAIFRNTIYALKGYKFTTRSWTDFFNKYLVGYNGRYTNNEVMAMFNEREKWLLDLIIKYENGK